MIESPSQILWRECGSVPSPKAGPLPDTPGFDWTRCWVCAGPTRGRGAPLTEWDGAMFTGQSRVRYPRGQAICEPCLWVMARNTDVPGKTGNTRNYSWLYAAGEPLLIASKGDKPAIREWLRRPHAAPWFAALADTGQKHVVPYVPLNGPGSHRALFDEVPVDLPADDAGWKIVDDLTALLTAGATKEEVEAGDYRGALSRCEAMVRAFEREHGHKRGSGWFSLVVFLAQRDEAEVEARMAREADARAAKKAAEREAAKAAKTPRVKAPKPARAPKMKAAPVATAEEHDDGAGAERSDEGSTDGRDGGRGDGTAVAVSGGGSERAEALGSDHRPPPSGDADVHGTGGVDHEALPRPPDQRAVQLSLFGFGGPGGDGAEGGRKRVARPRRA